MESANEIGVLFAPGKASEVDVGDLRDKYQGGNGDKDKDGDGDGDDGGDEEGLGGERDRADAGDGLGDGATGLGLSWTACAAGLVLCGLFM